MESSEDRGHTYFYDFFILLFRSCNLRITFKKIFKILQEITSKESHCDPAVYRAFYMKIHIIYTFEIVSVIKLLIKQYQKQDFRELF